MRRFGLAMDCRRSRIVSFNRVGNAPRVERHGSLFTPLDARGVAHAVKRDATFWRGLPSHRVVAWG